jgi:hypothetical protein
MVQLSPEEAKSKIFMDLLLDPSLAVLDPAKDWVVGGKWES